MYNKATAQAMLMALKPGESLKPHKSEVCEADTLIESPAEIVHYISNDTNNLARILVVKAPRPISLTKVL